MFYFPNHNLHIFFSNNSMLSIFDSIKNNDDISSIKDTGYLLVFLINFFAKKIFPRI